MGDRSYWNTVLGERTPADIVRDNELEGLTRGEVDAWLTEAEWTRRVDPSDYGDTARYRAVDAIYAAVQELS